MVFSDGIIDYPSLISQSPVEQIQNGHSVQVHFVSHPSPVAAIDDIPSRRPTEIFMRRLFFCHRGITDVVITDHCHHPVSYSQLILTI